jgi:UDP-glucose 4-epimerase
MDTVEVYAGDLADLALVRRVMRGVEVVYHLACSAGAVPTEDGLTTDHGHAVGTLHVLHAASEARARRVLYASSLWVYGNGAAGPVGEGVALDPQAYVGRVKLSGEEACRAATRLSGLETVRLRLFHVFGPRQRAGCSYGAPVARALEALAADEVPRLDGDGEAERDLIYVEDAVHAALLAAEAPRVAGKVYNIGRGHAVADREVVARLAGLMGARVEPTWGGGRAASAGPIADVRRAEVELGFCASTDLDRGLRGCVEARAQATGRPHFGRAWAEARLADCGGACGAVAPEKG